MRSASSAVVIEPSTSERSYGPSTVARRRLEEVGDLDLAGEREQLVLAVEQAELAAVAGGELPDRELRLARARHHTSRMREDVPRCARSVNTGPSRQTNVGPNWQWPQWPTRALHVALHRDVDALRRRRPRSSSASAAKRIITSGPQTKRDRVRRVERRARDQRRHDADVARASRRVAMSTVTSTSRPRRAPARRARRR